MKFWLTFATTLFLMSAGAPARGAGVWTTCPLADLTAGTTITNFQIQTKSVKCWEYNGDDDTPAVSVTAVSALICLNPDLATEGAATANMMIRRCDYGRKPSSNPERSCGTVLDLALTGLGGAAGTQNSCIRVGPGVYYGESTVGSGGESAVLSFTGE